MTDSHPYKWAVSTVMTRQNFIPSSSSNGMELALIPWWDMNNHDNAELTTNFNMEENRSEHRTCRSFAAGDQVFMFYGKRPNSEFFLHDGFVHINNNADGVKVRLGVAKSDPLFNLKHNLLTELGVPTSTEFLVPCSRPFYPAGKFLAFLRVFNMNQGELEDWTANENKDDLISSDIKLPVDAKVCKYLSVRLQVLLAVYKTTIEDDEKMLSEIEISPRRKLAISQRLTERRLLTNAMTDLRNLENAAPQKD